MIFFLYLLFFLIFSSSIFLFFYPKKARRVFYLLAYFLPLWGWGEITLFLSVLLWNSRNVASIPFIISLLSIISFIKGGFLILLPKRGIKKKIEIWGSLSLDKIRLTGIGVFLLSLIIFIAIF